MESKAHISVRNLNVWYGPQKALNNINIDIPDKKITAIIGPSGCGKTTLLKSFNRLIDLQDGVRVNGRVLVDGEDIYAAGMELTHLRKKIGLLSQRPQVLPMSIYENVAYGPRLHGLNQRRQLDEIVQYYLKKTGLWDEVKNRLPSSAAKLSIGQQQRLCLARGLANAPEIILGDEPTSALDPISAEGIEQRLLELKDQYTIVLVTHILRQAKRLADYVIFLYLGDIIEHGPAQQVFENPRYAKTAAYLNGRHIPACAPDRELNLQAARGSEIFTAATAALAELAAGQILKVTIASAPDATGLPAAMERDGHKILEVKPRDQAAREIIIQKKGHNYAV